MAKSNCTATTLGCAATSTPYFDKDGTLWIAARAGNALFVTRSRDRGATFAPSVVIETAGAMLDWGPDARPAILRDAEGHVVVAYATFRDKNFNGEVFVTRSDVTGEHFAPPTPITNVQESQRFQALALDADGSLFAAWLDKRNRRTLPAGAAYTAGLAFAWARKDEADVPHFADARIAIDNTCECCRLAVAFAAPGRPVVLFRDNFGRTTRDHAVVTFADPQTPGPVRRVSVDDWRIDACPHHGPSLAIAPDGSYHAAWFTQGRVRQGLFYARSVDSGATFSAPLPVGRADRRPSRPFVLASGGTIRVAWKEFDGETTRVFVMTSHDDGVSFGPAAEIARTAENSDHPLLLGDGHRAFLSWQTEKEGYRLMPLGGAS